jgi:hypothetical protein
MSDKQIIIERIVRFRDDLSRLETPEIVQKHITSGDCFKLNHDQYFDLRNRIAQRFGVHPNQVLAVGSAKLGFSIAPKKRYQHFHEMSDIDVAVVADSLFDRTWEAVLNYRRQVGYWEHLGKFQEYLFQGWIRPDKLPPAETFAFGKEWWEFFRELTSSGNYGRCKIAAGLYRSPFFLERYQEICVKECKAEISIA